MPPGIRGILVYCAVCRLGMVALGGAMKLAGLEMTGAGGAGVLAAMWIPALARGIAVRTVDREFTEPFSIRRWGRPRAAVIVVPLVSVVVIYLTAYGASALFGVARAAPRWQGAGKIATNLVVNLLLGSAIGLLGGMGEELGWRGYLQPRLDQLRVPYSLLVTSVIETAYHLPFILWGRLPGVVVVSGDHRVVFRTRARCHTGLDRRHLCHSLDMDGRMVSRAPQRLLASDPSANAGRRRRADAGRVGNLSGGGLPVRGGHRVVGVEVPLA